MSFSARDVNLMARRLLMLTRMGSRKGVKWRWGRKFLTDVRILLAKKLNATGIANRGRDVKAAADVVTGEGGIVEECGWLVSYLTS